MGTGLAALHAQIAPRFGRKEVRQHALSYLEGLLAPVERKNSWQLAEHAGDKTPDGIQRLLNHARWSADEVRDDLRAYVVEHLGDAGGVLMIDETGFLKKGTHSCGVKRQYSGTAGRIENCQIGVLLGYASRHGRTLLDRELYLPEEWAKDSKRRKQAHVPPKVRFATKPQLARRMLERALDAGVPCTWVTGDSVYGGDRSLRMWLEGREQPFVLGVACNEAVWVREGAAPRQVRADAVAAAVPAADWQRLSCGEGAKGPRLYDWALVRLARLSQRKWGHWLLVRRSIAKPEEVAYYVAFGPADTSMKTLVEVAGMRWSIECCIEVAKQEVGLGEYEVRRYDAWYRHITLSMLAQAYLNVMRAQAALADDEKGGRSGDRPTVAANHARSPSSARTHRLSRAA
jgi:SRSO17 transposase